MGYLLLNTYKLCASDIVDAATDLVSSQILQIAHIIIKIIHDSISANLSSHCREMKDKFDFLRSARFAGHLPECEPLPDEHVARFRQPGGRGGYQHHTCYHPPLAHH